MAFTLVRLITSYAILKLSVVRSHCLELLASHSRLKLKAPVTIISLASKLAHSIVSSNFSIHSKLAYQIFSHQLLDLNSE